MTKTFLNCLLVACLVGCADMAGLDKHAGSTLMTPDKIGARNVEVRWPSDPWWRRYQDPSLDKLVEQALSQSPDLHMARLRMEQAAAVAEQTDAKISPRFSSAVQARRQRYAQAYDASAPLAGNAGSSIAVHAEAQYTFDFWGGQHAALSAAVGEMAARAAEAQAARTALASSIVKAWIELARLIAARALAQEGLVLRSQTLRIVERRIQAGLDTQLERTQAQSDLPATQRDIARLDEQIQLQRHVMAMLVGVSIDALSSATPRPLAALQMETPEAVPAQLIGRRPDVVAARWRVEVAAGEVLVAQADFYPNVSLRAFAGLGRQGRSVGLSDWLNASSRYFGIEPAISLPIFDGARLRARLKGRTAELDAAVESYNKALLGAVRDVADQIVSADALAPQSSAQREALAARRTAFDLARRQYAAGLSNYLNVLAAQNTWLHEQQQQLDLDARSRVLDVELQRALGGGFDANDIPTIIERKM
ncbi:efflux transporter outer membrane subunit [Comamonas sp. MYb21]|uniref:efflux transporter outer membrane subunit n=1 Tax=Comamonas sp. MYb21 TaxID=1848648 RepID=UPI0030B6A4C7